jgi:hypothetical protein
MSEVKEVLCPNPGCGQRLGYRPENAGRRAQCRKCGCWFQLPAAGGPPPAPRPPSGPRPAPAAAKPAPPPADDPPSPDDQVRTGVRNIGLGVGIFWIVYGCFQAVAPLIEAAVFGLKQYVRSRGGTVVLSPSPDLVAGDVILFAVVVLSGLGLVACGAFVCRGSRLAVYLGLVAVLPLLMCGVSYADGLGHGHPGPWAFLFATFLPFAVFASGILLVRQQYMLRKLGG